MPTEDLIGRLSQVKRTGKGQWLACCPAHDDSDPSMSIRELDDGRILIHCFAGCTPAEIMGSVGLSMADLFPEGYLSHRKRSLLPEAHRKAEGQYKDRLLLQLAMEKRSRGERLSEREMRLEREAFSRVKGLR